MKILVTGGAGFIGSNFVRRSRKMKPDVEMIILDSLTYAGRLSNLAGLENEIEFLNGDIRDARLVDQIISRVDAVIHFAAESHNDNSLRDPRPFLETNVIGTFELIQACVKHSVRFHHISTDEVFGDLPLGGGAKFTPETPYNPSSPYSATKASSDMLVRSWGRSFGLQATISNCSNNYGPYQHEEKLIPRTILLAASGIKPKVYGNGLNVRDWIHVDDHTDGVWAILEKGKIEKTYLLGADGEQSNLQVVQGILRHLNLSDDFIEFVPDRPGHDVRYAIDATKTRTELDWKPKHESFEDSLAAVVTHYVSLAQKGEIELGQISTSGLSASRGI